MNVVFADIQAYSVCEIEIINRERVARISFLGGSAGNCQ